MSVGALNQDAPFAARAQGPGAPLGRGRAVQPVKLGNLLLPNRYFLAPLAGVSDCPFRLLGRELGASIAHTALISRHGLGHGGSHPRGWPARPPRRAALRIPAFRRPPRVLAP